jgi:hypothetical protein
VHLLEKTWLNRSVIFSTSPPQMDSPHRPYNSCDGRPYDRYTRTDHHRKSFNCRDVRHARQETVVCPSMIGSGTADVATVPTVGILHPAPGTCFFGRTDPTPQNRRNDLACGVVLADESASETVSARDSRPCPDGQDDPLAAIARNFRPRKPRDRANNPPPPPGNSPRIRDGLRTTQAPPAPAGRSPRMGATAEPNGVPT